MIVCLNETEPTQAMWTVMRRFSNVYFVKVRTRGKEEKGWAAVVVCSLTD